MKWNYFLLLLFYQLTQYKTVVLIYQKRAKNNSCKEWLKFKGLEIRCLNISFCLFAWPQMYRKLELQHIPNNFFILFFPLKLPSSNWMTLTNRPKYLFSKTKTKKILQHSNIHTTVFSCSNCSFALKLFLVSLLSFRKWFLSKLFFFWFANELTHM